MKSLLLNITYFRSPSLNKGERKEKEFPVSLRNWNVCHYAKELFAILILMLCASPLYSETIQQHSYFNWGTHFGWQSDWTPVSATVTTKKGAQPGNYVIRWGYGMPSVVVVSDDGLIGGKETAKYGSSDVATPLSGSWHLYDGDFKSPSGKVLKSWYFIITSISSLGLWWDNNNQDDYVAKQMGRKDLTLTIPLARDPGCPPCFKKKCKPCKGMPVYGLHSIFGTLNLQDVPLSYDVAFGPAMSFGLTYNQEDGELPETDFEFSNVGPHWNYNWLSYIRDNADEQISAPIRYMSGGGFERYYEYDEETQTYKTEYRSRARLVKVSSSPISYTRYLPDGTEEVYSQAVGQGENRRILLTSITDPQGNMAILHYDTQHRLSDVTDALGQKLTFSYELIGDPYKITKVTDPYGRTARMTYDALGRLRSITDQINLTSRFTYKSDTIQAIHGITDAYVINSMTTPYGTTYFDSSMSTDYKSYVIQVTDPEGNKERLEYCTSLSSALMPATGGVPSASGFLTDTTELNQRNTFHWDKKAMKEIENAGIAVGTAAFYAKAYIQHWVNGPYGITSVLESEKEPLEGRVWYNYQGQTDSRYIDDTTIISPSAIARVLDDGTTQISRAAYNAEGRILSSTDPIGRTTLYTYDANGVDLLQIRQQNGSGSNILASYSGYNNHQPQFVTDAAGQIITMSYNTVGQMLGVTNSLGQSTTNTYITTGSLTGRLQSIDGPLPGNSDVTTYTYDSKGRVRTITDGEGYTTTTDYDDFDRVIKVTYPDSTYEQITYNRFDEEWTRDRKGRWSRQWVNGIRQVIMTQDAENHILSYDWCPCGSIKSLADEEGHVTKWSFDTQGRVTAKTYADNTQTTYTYENTTSRLKSFTDALGQVATYTYTVDDRVASVAYTNATHYTPSVSYTYDPAYPRLSTMTDGEGTTTYAYNPYNGQLGAGKLASVDGPYANDTVTYTYDALGRITAQALNGVTSAVAFDTLGRVTTASNPLGTFTYSYVNATGRLAQMIYPNGQTTIYSYWGNTATSGTGNGDERLKEIKHLNPSTGLISKFNYEYDTAGQIVKWKQEAETPAEPKQYTFYYDGADQLVSAVLKNATSSAVLKQYHYVYNKAGNRTTEQIDQQPTQGTFNNLNQLTALSGGSGQMLVSGTTSKDSVVTVNSIAATMTQGTNFWAKINVTTGTNTFTVAATDFRTPPNTTTQSYQVVTTATGTSALTYDLNGNCISDGTRTYEWDAKNQLIAINYTGTSKRTEFTYDGNGNRVKILEKDNGSLASFKAFVWNGGTILEERDATNAASKRYYPQGFFDVAASAPYFYTKDHLDSIREITDSSGVTRARYDYDPYGRVTKLSGDVNSDFLYTGHYYHSSSNLYLAKYRVYDPTLGRWLSRDPISERGGINLYQYCNNDPINYRDPSGKAAVLVIWTAIVVVVPAIIYVYYLINKWFSDPCNRYLVKELIQNTIYTFVVLTTWIPHYIFNSSPPGDSSKPKTKPADSPSDTATPTPPPTPTPPDDDDDNGPDYSINQINKAIKRGKAPDSIERADRGRNPHEQDHIHFKDGNALNADGTWKHGPGRLLKNIERKFLEDQNWPLKR